MKELVPTSADLPTQFDPSEAKRNLAKAGAMAEYAAKMQEWELLGAAVDAIIEQQTEVVRWWGEAVKGAGNPAKKGQDLIGQERGQLTQDDAEAEIGYRHQAISDWKRLLKDAAKYREGQIVAAKKKAKIISADNHRAEGTGENEWFTPEKYIIAARDVMGGIDLDPATHPAAQETVRAEAFFTRADDGLSKPWHGRVWLNPPYAQPEIWHFVEKLGVELCADRVQEAILLTHNYTDTAWFHHAESIAAAVCFTRGRIKFEDIDGEVCSPTQGQAFFYYGENVESFCRVFNDFGFVVKPS